MGLAPEGDGGSVNLVGLEILSVRLRRLFCVLINIFCSFFVKFYSCTKMSLTNINTIG